MARALPGQVVLVFQGGGALGAYQAGVYEALHEAGIEPDWVIGTSIGAINAALIAGNPPAKRMARIDAFWNRMQASKAGDPLGWLSGFGAAGANLGTIARGIPGFFAPNPAAWIGPHVPLGAERAAYYTTAPLRDTLEELLEPGGLGRGPRITVGAVNVRTGQMRYFDSRDAPVGIEHVAASGALPPAFPAVRIDGELYWDGGIYSNTPMEAVLDDRPRRDSLIFTVHLWNPEGPEPETVWAVGGREKDIQYASRAASHIERQRQIHRLRHVIRELESHLPAAKRRDARVRELCSWGCGTTMHVVRLLAPRLAGEDQLKDIDFSPAGVRARRAAGLADARIALERSPWMADVDPMDGVIVHDAQATSPGSHPG